MPDDGRLYQVNCTVKDPAGASCIGTVFIGVPHDQGQHTFVVILRSPGTQSVSATDTSSGMNDSFMVVGACSNEGGTFSGTGSNPCP